MVRRMLMLRFFTAGESHGQALIGILEGMPAGLQITRDYINHQLRRRQKGYGRGGRVKIERDEVEILSGVRFGRTLGSPIALLIRNRDWTNWREEMAVEDQEAGRRVTVPRPGHADLAGVTKYRHGDIRNVLERSSARETAMRVAICTPARRLLEEFGVCIASHVISIGKAEGRGWEPGVTLLNEAIDRSPVRCIDPEAEEAMMAEIDRATKSGDSIGGIFEVVVTGLPVGLGSYAQWDRRLDGLLAQAMMSIQAIKGVEIGLGFESARRPGSKVHDEIYFGEGGYYRKTNNAGGIEGGVTNGEPVVIRAAMKPIPTLSKPLHSVDINTKQEREAHRERSDVCAVPAASVVGEAVVAFTLANAFLEKFGGDSLDEIRERIGDVRKGDDPG